MSILLLNIPCLKLKFILKVIEYIFLFSPSFFTLKCGSCRSPTSSAAWSSVATLGSNASTTCGSNVHLFSSHSSLFLLELQVLHKTHIIDNQGCILFLNLVTPIFKLVICLRQKQTGKIVFSSNTLCCNRVGLNFYLATSAVSDLLLALSQCRLTDEHYNLQ